MTYFTIGGLILQPYIANKMAENELESLYGCGGYNAVVTAKRWLLDQDELESSPKFLEIIPYLSKFLVSNIVWSDFICFRVCLESYK